MTARRLVVHGRVQGVWFRDGTRREAERLGVDGWVRNRPDGAVEAWLQGEDEAVGALEAWCAGGPPRAEVSRVDAEDVAPDPGLVGFDIR